jgi:transcriptional regulator with XRE-family HTH domain
LKILGGKIRTLRLSRHFKLRDLAERAGCTTPYISQIEKGNVSPSISVLKSIANALGVRLVDLFVVDDQSPDDVVVRAGQGAKIKYPRGDASLSLLTKHLDGKTMEPLLKVLPPGAGSDGLYSHSGSQEFGYVLSGEFNLLIEDNVFTVKAGDSFYFNSSRPHGFVNNGSNDALILWVISPPTY